MIFHDTDAFGPGQGKGCPPGIAVVCHRKNGGNHYMPEWMKMDSEVSILSERMVSRWILPRHMPRRRWKLIQGLHRIHEVSGDPQHTVILGGAERARHLGQRARFFPVAQQLFEQPVPDALLKPVWHMNILRARNLGRGIWDRCRWYFHAWSVARYIEYVAAAGKAVNPCPCL